ncbi:MAG: DUF2752 domain-containing protein [Clostridia bacterium]|nr:DUF2752 domain-containing protein [Clostridia bacterium]
MMKKYQDKLLITAALLIYALVLGILKIPCPILGLTGIPCPGCGMTRALLAAARLDLAGAFAYHPMFWAVPILYLCFWKDGKLFRKKELNIALYGILAVGFLINWLRGLFL